MTFFTFPIFAFGVTDSFPYSVSLLGFLFRSYVAFTVLLSCLLVFLIRNLFPLLISLLIVLILSSLSGISFTSLFLYAITIGLVIFRRVLLFFNVLCFLCYCVGIYISGDIPLLDIFLYFLISYILSVEVFVMFNWDLDLVELIM